MSGVLWCLTYVDLPYYFNRECLQRKEHLKSIHNIEEATIFGDVYKATCKIYATLDNRSVDYQTTTVEVKGKIGNHPLSILIGLGAIHSYFAPRIAEVCVLKRNKHGKYS